MTTTSHLINSLKTCLKQKGLVYADVATHLAISVASIKRLLNEESISLKRLGQICELMDLDLSQLILHAEKTSNKLHQLSRVQEQALVDNDRLLMVFYYLINDWTAENIRSNQQLTEHEITHFLAQLDRLDLIELEPGNRARLKVSRAVRWLPNGPIRQYFDKKVLPEFLSGKFTSEGEHYQYIPARLGHESILKIEQALIRLGSDINEIIRGESIVDPQARSGVGIMLALRKWYYTAFQPQITEKGSKNTISSSE